MNKNFLDDDIIKKNKALISGYEKREGAKKVEEDIEVKSSSFKDIYNEENSKALIEGVDVIDIKKIDDIKEKRKIDINLKENKTLKDESVFIKKALTKDGKLIDPEDALEDEEYNYVLIKERKSDSFDLKNEIKYKDIYDEENSQWIEIDETNETIEGIEPSNLSSKQFHDLSTINSERNEIKYKDIYDEDESKALVENANTDEETETLKNISNKEFYEFETSSELLTTGLDRRIIKKKLIQRDENGDVIKMLDPDDLSEGEIEEDYEEMYFLFNHRVDEDDKTRFKTNEELINSGRNEIKYKKHYDNEFYKGIGVFSDKRAFIDSDEEVEANVDDLNIREKDTNEDSRELSIFMYNIMPYAVSSMIDGIDPTEANTGFGAMNYSIEAASLYNKLSYLNPAELVFYLANNFYTLWLLKRVTIKEPKRNLIPGGATSYNGRPNIFFGREQAFNLMKELSKVANALGNFISNELEDGEMDNQAISLLKDAGGDETGNVTFENYKPGSPMPLSPRIKIGLEGAYAEKMFSSPKGILTGPGDKNKREEQKNAQEKTEFKLSSFDFNGKWSTDPNKLFFKSGNNTLVTQKSGFNENSLIAIGNYGVENLNGDLSFINLKIKDEDEKAVIDAVKDKINGKNTKTDIGYLLISPITSESGIENFWVPFQTNPNIQEAGVVANYEATQVLSRIGEMQSYSGTGSFTVTIDTKYIALSPETDDKDMEGWMGYYTLPEIQRIEMAYRSLVLPHYPNDNNGSNGYKYIKPPLIKVVLGEGGEEEGNGIYSALLTYQTNTMVDNHFQSENGNDSKKRHRNFIATSVSINKDIVETPLYIGKKGGIIDTFGFSVQLSLTEVTRSYMDTYPDFKDYYTRYTSNNNVLI